MLDMTGATDTAIAEDLRALMLAAGQQHAVPEWLMQHSTTTTPSATQDAASHAPTTATQKNAPKRHRTPAAAIANPRSDSTSVEAVPAMANTAMIDEAGAMMTASTPDNDRLVAYDRQVDQWHMIKRYTI